MEGVILLLEDEESVNRGVCFTLKKAGYQVYACGSIREAQQLLERHQPQMLICDLTLPDGSGLDFIAKVRKNDSDIYILCLTALDSET
ncbi:MAG: response regulator, partial [Lachnospiraceae bacterium]|nr:response regulator [Lachnospiraceae bacterium]